MHFVLSDQSLHCLLTDSMDTAEYINKGGPGQTIWAFTVHIRHKDPLLELSSALSSARYFISHFCKQCGPRSDCSFRSSLIWVHTVCLYAKIG